MALDLSKIISRPLPDNQYYNEKYQKKQIVLHHTVSGVGIEGDLNHWASTPERVATCVIIDRDGVIYQCFSSALYAHHLGIKADFLKKMGLPLTANDKLNKESIGIELDSWGGLVKDADGEWYVPTWDVNLKKFFPNKKLKVDKQKVQEYPNGYRGFFGFEKYTQAQLDKTKELIQYWSAHYSIPKTYNSDMWDVTMNALKGNAGIYSHTSYRTDKSDVHPQPELIQMLQTL